MPDSNGSSHNTFLSTYPIPQPRVLILGTMPSVKSLEDYFYYAHPRNAFWPILFDLFAQTPSSDKKKRTQLIENHHLALWDVLHGCQRKGSLDQAIQQEVPNDIKGLLKKHPSIQTIAFNGQPAFKFYKRHLGPPTIPHLILPSTSPAHASKTKLQKQEEWAALLPCLLPKD
ncbi:DNA-deoxyinosine glycosylase [bacterium SCSIO 12741]|nr:DNA-deoxyinosine glycosylase [bacterium SCSIO 12741]